MNKVYITSFLLIICLFWYGYHQESDMQNSAEIMATGLTISILSFSYFIFYQVKNVKEKLLSKNEDFHSDNRNLKNREMELRNEHSDPKQTKKVPIVEKNQEPNRKITETSTMILNNVYSKSIQTMLGNSCPCHYPRFRKMVAFHQENKTMAPVFCVDSNFLIQAAVNPKLGFLTPVEVIDNPDEIIGVGTKETIYACKKCDSIYKEVALAFKGNLKRLYLDTMVANFQKDIGASDSKQFPVFQGFFSDDSTSLNIAKKNYFLGEEKEVFLHLVER